MPDLFLAKEGSDYSPFDWDYLRGCARKIPYATKEEAQKKVEEFQDPGLSIYECLFFHHYHLGHA